MRRRELMLLLGAVIAWPLAARAQQKRVPVVGFLHSASPGPAAPYLAAFRQGLSETGYVEGQNVAIEYRWAEGRYDRLPALAADLVGRKVDLIATGSGGPSALAAKSATSTIPIVFASVSDPVEIGLVASLARPGGNVTGAGMINVELMPKRLEFLSELVPQAKVIALLTNLAYASAERSVRETQEAARTRGAASHPEGRHRKRDRRRFRHPRPTASRRAPRRRRSILLQPARAARGAGITPCRSGDLCVARVPASGGLISYGASQVAAIRQAGIYAGRILNGEKPADLPVQQPTKFELVINLKTAQALGLTVPQSILARADEVIECRAGPHVSLRSRSGPLGPTRLCPAWHRRRGVYSVSASCRQRRGPTPRYSMRSEKAWPTSAISTAKTSGSSTGSLLGITADCPRWLASWSGWRSTLS